MSEKKSVKLFNSFVPTSYNLNVSVDLSTWTYAVEERITLVRNHSVKCDDEIQLHGAPTTKINLVEGGSFVRYDPDVQTLIFKLDNTTEEKTELLIKFDHIIQEELRGFYQVRFNHDGREHRMASTHFEPTAARTFYICQDEPAQRADYTLTVNLPERDQHYTVLSNGPLKDKTVANGTASYVFETIPSCPPYLTACVVGELEFVETMVNGVPVRVYTALGKSHRAHFALKTTAFALDLFEKFFQAKFPLPKLDVVAVPDFPIGGMENWGCIACIDSILVDPETSSIASLKRASELICHEVSHNWFGNLVAISWWEGLWLKEGFASWCGYYASNLYEPSWNCLEDAAADVGGALETDMYENSHPVEVPIADPAQITEIFDSISYDKGMGLVFMLEAFLGKDKWSAAVAHYINKHQFKDTRTIQLWEALEEASGLPITEAMQSFTTQMGYPLLVVERPAPDTITIAQRPCKLASTTAKSEQLWTVPLTVKGSGEEHLEVILKGADVLEVKLSSGIAKEAFVTVNPSRAGFFRCRYDDTIFANWLENYDSLPTAERRALISDCFASIQAGFEDVERFAAISEMVRRSEKERSVLREYYGAVKNLIACFTEKPIKSALRRQYLDFFVDRANEALSLNKAGETPQEKLCRVFLTQTALQFLISEYSAEEAAANPLYIWSQKQVDAFLAGAAYEVDSIAPCLAAYVRFNVSKSTTAKNEELMQKFSSADGNDELCRALLQGMLAGDDTEFIKKLCLRCTENDGVRSHFGGTVFMHMCANPFFGSNEIWNFFKQNFPAVDRQWGGGQFRIQVIVSQVGHTLDGNSSALEYQKFFMEHPLPNARLAIARSVENIQLRHWIEGKWSNILRNSFYK